jgi:hypothetical protein
MCRSPLLKRALRCGEHEVVGLQPAGRQRDIVEKLTRAALVGVGLRGAPAMFEYYGGGETSLDSGKKVTFRVEDCQNFCIAAFRLPTSIFVMKEPNGRQLAVVSHEQLVSNLLVSGFQHYPTVNHFSHVTPSLPCYPRRALRRRLVAFALLMAFGAVASASFMPATHA